MKKLLLLIIITTTLFCNAQTLTTWSEIKTQRFGKEAIYKTKKDKHLKGYYKIASDKGNYSEIHFKNGKIDGIRKDYDNNGELTSTRAYKNGKYHGEWKYYNNNGEVKTIENYKEGNKDGKWWKKFSTNNNYYTKTAYYHNNTPTGTWTEKWQNGNLKEERTYKGKGTYVLKKYHTNGKLHQQKSYKNFKLDGIQLVYSSSGILIKRDAYKNDLLEKKESFFDNSRPYQVYNLRNGRLHGYFIEYKRSGAKSLEGYYDNGNETGLWKKYRGDNGWLYFETTYKNDTQNGSYKSYYRSGIIETEGNYLNGSRNGIWKVYNEAGKLIKEITYDKGTEVERKEYNK